MIGERAYENALKRRDQLREELTSKQRELDEVQDFLKLCERFAGMAAKEGGDQFRADIKVLAPDVSKTPTRRKLTTVSGMDLLPHIRTAILEIGKPLKRGPIVRALEDRGIRVGGEEPARNIGTIMWRAKTERREFESFEKLGYWPSDVAYPPAGYAPTQDQDAESDDDDRQEHGSASTGAGASADLWAAKSSE